MVKIKNVIIDIDMLSNGAIANVILCDLDVPCQGQVFKMPETVRASDKMRDAAVIDFDICHLMTPMKKFYTVTLSHFFKFKYFKCYYCKKNMLCAYYRSTPTGG